MTTYTIEDISITEDLPVTLRCHTCQEVIVVDDIETHTMTHGSFHIQIEPRWVKSRAETSETQT